MSEEYRPGTGVRLLASAVDAYKTVFVQTAAARVLSRPSPVRRDGYERAVVIDRIEAEAEDVVSLTLRDPYWAPLPEWSPGAHLDLFLPSGRQRQYSLDGDPADRARYRISVRRIADGGGGSLEVHDTLRVGDELRIRGPRNAFPFIAAPAYVFVAGGIGITPILPMVTEAARAAIPWRLVYLGRSRASMPFLSHLAGLGGGELVVRPDDEFGVAEPADLIDRVPAGSAAYVCGPPALMDAAALRLRALDPGTALYTERFSPLPVRDGVEFDLTLRRSGHTVRVGAEESALAAIRRVLPGVAYSCQQGFCGTCKVAVLNGTVEHRDRRLADHERADYMLTCVSRSRGSELTLDL
ncbi:PDR/VanB family oxidoreductase [Nocardia arizonensis]|uniref:PDR/VanB family oxidoreductase n=1 Tax=Nocardia arizonensis TaxID=1141647 RepID=UPI0006D2920F|nr:PDR/VanB family oxidoreductase [Nocardia arizonensis]